MRLLRIEVIGSLRLAVDFSVETSTAPSLCILLGPNGSGKSLLAAALRCICTIGDKQKILCSELSEYGVSEINVYLRYLEYDIHIVCDTIAQKQSIRFLPFTTSSPLQNEDVPDSFLIPAENPLVSEVHIVRSGKLDMPLGMSLGGMVLKAVRLPLERELAGWMTRKSDLAGEDDKGGRLSAARQQLNDAEHEQARVEGLWRELETLRAREQEINSRVDEARIQGDILSAEIAELEKLQAIAMRASRLDAWIEEIRREIRDVQRLREHHAELQSQIEPLEERFRMAPDELPDLLEQYARVQDSLAEWNRIHEEHRISQEGIQAELNRVRSELANLRQPTPDERLTQQDALRKEQDDANRELTDLLRGRIELVRQRDGVMQQLSGEYSPFAALNPFERARLEAEIEEKLKEIVPVPTGPTASTLEREKRLTVLKYAIKEKYPGFERLPSSVAELLREYHDLRRIQITLGADIESLQKRTAALRRKIHPGHSIIWSCAAAAAAFGAVTVPTGWDIGLFAALVASGIALLVFRYIHRGVESELESTTAAEDMIQRRAEETRTAKSRIEQVLGPLAAISSYEAALRRYQDYRRLADELDNVSTQETEPAAPVVKEPEERKMTLHSTGEEVPISVLRRRYDTFCEIERRQQELEEAWKEYEEAGIKTRRIQDLQEQLINLQEQHAAILNDIQSKSNDYDASRRCLLDRVSELEGNLADLSSNGTDEDRLIRLREELCELTEKSGGLLLDPTDIESLRSDWAERETLRIRLREIRGALSNRQTYDELRARELLLMEEAAQVRQQITTLDPLFMLQGTSVEYAAKYAGQLQAVKYNLEESLRTLSELEAAANACDTGARLSHLASERPLPELEADVNECRERVESLERDLMTTRELIALIHDELADKESTVHDELATAIDRCLRTLTDDMYLSLDMQEGRPVVHAADGSIRRLDLLSEGTRDLIWIAVRLGVLEVVRATDDAPLIWDEALTRLDDIHQTKVRDMLMHIAKDRQVILFTRHSALACWGQTLSLSESRAELPTGTFS